MFELTRIQFLVSATAGALVTLSAASTPARTNEMLQNLGPVGPHEPILSSVGSMRVIAFYEPHHGNCVFQAVVWEGEDIEAKTAKPRSDRSHRQRRGQVTRFPMCSPGALDHKRTQKTWARPIARRRQRAPQQQLAGLVAPAVQYACVSLAADPEILRLWHYRFSAP